MKNVMKRFWCDESGSQAGEYMVITASMCVGAIGSIVVVRDSLVGQFDGLADAIDFAIDEGGSGEGGI